MKQLKSQCSSSNERTGNSFFFLLRLHSRTAVHIPPVYGACKCGSPSTPLTAHSFFKTLSSLVLAAYLGIHILIPPPFQYYILYLLSARLDARILRFDLEEGKLILPACLAYLPWPGCWRERRGISHSAQPTRHGKNSKGDDWEGKHQVAGARGRKEKKLLRDWRINCTCLYISAHPAVQYRCTVTCTWLWVSVSLHLERKKERSKYKE